MTTSKCAFIYAVLTSIVLLGRGAVADELDGAVDTQSDSRSVSISVNSSTMDDGVNEPKSSITGKVTITGPDGIKKELDLGDALQGDGIPGNLNSLLGTEESAERRPMIGVMSQPVSDLLRKHLKLGINGIVVANVSEDMPAAKAGIVKGDIILKADGKNITNMQDLAVVVTESEGRDFDIELLHEGEKKTVTLKAKVTAMGELSLPADDALRAQLNQLMLRGMGPGMRLGHGEDVEKQITQLMEKTRKAWLDARMNHGNQKSMNHQLEKLRDRVAELEKRLADGKKTDSDD